MQADLVIDVADAGDVAAMAKLEKRTQLNPWSLAAFLLEISREEKIIFTAKRAGQLIGFVCGWLVVDEAQLHNLVVAPECRRRGIAFALLEHFIGEARLANAGNVTLEARVSNVAAVALYRKFSFAIVGRRPAYYRNPQEDAWLFECTIEKD